MFYYIEGIITIIQNNLVVVDAGGVGYACHTSSTTINQVRQGSNARLYTHLNVREDVFELYGFASEQELSCFQMLIGVSGVGPKAAASILSVAPTERLTLAIVTGDDKLLQQAQGIGKKIAQRIVLELRDKLGKEQLQGAAAASQIVDAVVAGNRVNHTQEAIAALMVLGFSQTQVLNALESMDSASMEADEIIRQCLKKLSNH